MLRVLVLGQGLVGTSINENLSSNEKYDVHSLSKTDLDLKDFNATETTIRRLRPDVVIMAAGVVGGIEENINEPYVLGKENSIIVLNVIEACLKLEIQSVINLVPACVYPSNIARRMVPEDLWSGPMELTSLPYATAKMLGITLLNAARSQFKTNWISVVATNLYGTDSSIETHKAHVIPALLMKFTEAKNAQLPAIKLLGDGTPIREFLHVDDFALAIEFILEHEIFTDPVINVSGNTSWTIRELAELVAGVTKYEGDILFANDGKNGAMVKLLDSGKLHSLGWTPRIPLPEGIARVHQKFKI